VLLRGLPEEALTNRPDPTEPYWGATHELLAQVVEEVSVLASDRRRKKPREIERPAYLTGGKRGGGRRLGYLEMAARLAGMGRVRHG
jgi:hypothetical protein